MTKYSDTLAKVAEQVAALEKLEGYPKAPSFVGAACLPFVQADPLFGYTTKLSDVVDTKDGKADCDLDPALFVRHAGKSVVVDGKTVVIAPLPTKPAGAEQPKADAEPVVK